MKCADVQRRVTAFVDGELDEVTARGVRGHLRICPACQQLADGDAAVREAVADLPPIDPPPALWQGVMARLGDAEIADGRRGAVWRWWQRQRPRLLPMTAVAAAAATAAIWMWTHRVDDGAPEHLDPALAVHAPLDQAAPAAEPIASTEPDEPDEPAETLEAKLARERADGDAAYRAAVADLLTLAREERDGWAARRQARFDLELTRLEAAVTRAAGTDRERAWQALVGFLQRTALGDAVALGGR